MHAQNKTPCIHNGYMDLRWHIGHEDSSISLRDSDPRGTILSNSSIWTASWLQILCNHRGELKGGQVKKMDVLRWFHLFTWHMHEENSCLLRPKITTALSLLLRHMGVPTAHRSQAP